MNKNYKTTTMATLIDIKNIKGTKYLPNALTHWKPAMITSFLSNTASGNKVIVLS